jgi:F-type H+-transporting ATPase subunit alpha
METSHPEIGRDIAEKKRISDETMAKMRAALDEFTSTWQ